MSRIEVDLARRQTAGGADRGDCADPGYSCKKQYGRISGGNFLRVAGDNAGMFVRKGDSLQGKVAQTASDLKIAAANLRNAADRLYRAEKKAEELARLRSYGGGGGGRF